MQTQTLAFAYNESQRQLATQAILTYQVDARLRAYYEIACHQIVSLPELVERLYIMTASALGSNLDEAPVRCHLIPSTAWPLGTKKGLEKILHLIYEQCDTIFPRESYTNLRRLGLNLQSAKSSCA